MHRLWRASCPQSTRISFRESRHSARAARYVSKYVSKGVDVSEWTPKQRGTVLAASYGRRWVFSSRRFWIPEECACRRCGALRKVVQGAFAGPVDIQALAKFRQELEQIEKYPDPHEILTTLVIDLRDPSIKSLVWRGISTEEKSDATKIEGKLDDMVKKAIEKYPPKVK